MIHADGTTHPGITCNPPNTCFSRTDDEFLVTPKHVQVGGNHYQTGEHEPFLVIDEWSLTWPSGAEFYLGNALKYIARLGRKSQKYGEDLDKAIHYLQEARKRVGD